MREFWMITVHYGAMQFATIAIDEPPAQWLINWGDHGKRTEKHIVFAMQISEHEYQRINELRR
jgi:hypothetical protein